MYKVEADESPKLSILLLLKLIKYFRPGRLSISESIAHFSVRISLICSTFPEYER